MRVRIHRYRLLVAGVVMTGAVIAGCDTPTGQTSGHEGATCPVDDGTNTGSFGGADIEYQYSRVAAAIADGTAVQPPDEQTIPLLDGTPTIGAYCEGCSDVIMTATAATAPKPAQPIESARAAGTVAAASPDAVGAPKPNECNCPKTSWAFGNWSLPANYGLDPCGALAVNMKPFLFKPYTNACRTDTDCMKLLTQALENCQKILEILKGQEAGMNTGICQQTQMTRKPSFGQCEIDSLTALGCTNGGNSGDIWKCPAAASLPPKPCTSMTDFCGKKGGFVSCASDMWNTLNAADIKAGKKKACTFMPKASNSC